MTVGCLYEPRRRLVRKLFGRLTCALASAWPSRATIALMREANWILMSTAEVQAVTDTIRAVPHCRLLVFGVGHDSRYWTACNRGGTTVFIENDMDWARKISPEIGRCPIVEVCYSHRRSEWRRLIDAPEQLLLALPSDVATVTWDVILVDGPTGMLPEQHGRMQSIFTAARLVAPGGHVFVHDCDREVEQEYCNRFLGPANLRRQVGILRQYQMLTR